MTTEAIEKFIKDSGGLEFPRIIFRNDPGAVTTTPFGIDTSTGGITPIRIHLGTDRARGRFGHVYAPFSGTFLIEESSDYGTLFRLRVEDDFEIRIGHMKLSQIAVRNRPLPRIDAGELIGLAGSEGKSTGVHTCTQVVSIHGESQICEKILVDKGLDRPWFTPDQNRQKAGELWPALHQDLVAKAVLEVGPFKIKKLDPWTKEVQVYYDSSALFGF